MVVTESPKIDPGQLIVTPHPLLLEGQRNVVWEASANESLYSILMRNVPEMDGQQWIVSIGGLPVERHLWHCVKPKQGQVIEVRGGTGRSALAVVAMIALTYFTFGGGAIAGFTLGTSTALGTLAVQSAVYLAGSMLINKVLAPKVPKSSAQQQDSVYSLSGARNQLRVYEPLPLLFGRVQITPDLLSKPYTWYEGNDQYLALLLCAGINVGRVEEFFNGDTPLASYEGVQVYNAGYTQMPSQQIPLYSNADVIDGGQLLDTNSQPKGQPGAWVQRTTSTDTVKIIVGIEYQLYDKTTKGKDKNNTERVEIQYRPFGTSAWLNFGGQTLTSNKTQLYRAGYSREVTAGQYDVRVRTAGLNTDGSGANAAFTWTTLTSVQLDTADYTGLSRTGIQLKATGQLNGSPDEIRAIGYADPIPVWNGTSYVTQESSNPGAQILAYARGIARSGRLLGGMQLSEDQIDVEGLKAFTLHCAANNYTYDYYIKDARNHEQVISSIALAGFGQVTWAGGKLGIVWAAQDQPLSGVVNMATIRKGEFQVDYNLSNAADGIEYTYLDNQTWETKTLRVPAPGVVTMLNPAQVTGEGVGTEQHAARMARWHLGQSLYQYKDIGYSTDLEHMSYQRLSVLALSHDMTQWGYSGRIVAASIVGGVARLTLNEPVPSPPAGSAYIGVRIPGEKVYRVLRVASFTGPSQEISLAEPWPSDAPLPGSANNPAHDTTFIYDFKQTPGLRVRVVSVEPENDLKGAKVRAVQEGPEFWIYVLTGQYIPSPNASLLLTRPIASNLKISENQVVQGDTTFTELSATFDISGPVGNIVVRAAQDGKELEDVAQTQTRTATWRIPEAGLYHIVVRPYSPDGEPGIAVSGSYITAGADLPPVLVDLFDVEERSGGVRLYTWGWLSETIQSPDFNGVEIRYVGGMVPNPNWDTMTPVGDTGYHTAAFEAVVPDAGLWTFACRSRNTSGVLSTNMRVITKTLTQSLGEIIGDIDGTLEEQIAYLIALQQALEQEKTDRFNEDTRVLQEAADDATEKADAARDAAMAQIDALAAVVNDLLEAPEWVADMDYADNAYVSYDARLYIAKRPNTGQQPDISPDDWQMVGEFSSAGEALAAVIALANQNASDIAAEASRIDGVIARLPAGNGAVASAEALDEVIVRVEETEEGIVATGQRIESLRAETVGTYAGDEETNAGDTESNAGVISVAQVAATATYSQAKRIDVVQAEFGDFQATVTDTFETIASQNEATAERITQVQVELEGEVEAVANNLSIMGARVTQNEEGIEAVSQRIDSVEADIDENIAQAISGLEAQVSINTQGVAETKARAYIRVVAGTEANPVIGGMTIDNNGQTVATRFQSDIFEMVAPDTGSGTEIRNGNIRSWAGITQVIQGNGFGEDNFLLWAGPNVGIEAVTRAMATFYIDAGGNAYFGGTLAAGVLRNAVQTTTTQTIGTSLVNGPFATLGRNKNVVISFSRVHTRFKDALGSDGFVAGAGNNTATVNLYRKLASEANETLWYTLSVGGGVDITNNPDGTDVAISSWSASATLNDSTGGTQDRTYRAEIVGFTEQSVTHQSGSFNRQTITQNMAIVSVEV